MFALIACAAFTTNPLVAVQLKYPVRRITITSASGSITYYLLPENAPTELRRAYKILEMAERDVTLTEALQLLKLEIVQNERRLESLRTTALATAYMNPQNPGYTTGPFYMTLPAEPRESALKQRLARTIAREATTERAVLAIDRLADAQFQLHAVWMNLAFPDLPPAAGHQPAPAAGDDARLANVAPVAPPRLTPAAPPVPPGVEKPSNPVAGTSRINPHVAHDPAFAKLREEARQDVADAARELREALTQTHAAQTKRAAAERRYRSAPPEGKAEAKRELDDAAEAQLKAREAWDAAQKRLKAASERTAELAGLTRSAGVYPLTSAVRTPIPVTAPTPFTPVVRP